MENNIYINAVVDITADIERLEKYAFALKLIGGHEKEIACAESTVPKLKDRRADVAIILTKTAFKNIRFADALYYFLKHFVLSEPSNTLHIKANANFYTVKNLINRGCNEFILGVKKIDTSLTKENKSRIEQQIKSLVVMKQFAPVIADYFKRPEFLSELKPIIVALESDLKEKQSAIERRINYMTPLLYGKKHRCKYSAKQIADALSALYSQGLNYKDVAKNYKTEDKRFCDFMCEWARAVNKGRF